MTSNLCIVIATWNERQNLPDLARELRQRFPLALVLVVDDNSPDGTGRWAAEQSARDERLFLLSRGGREGLGRAAIDGLIRALALETCWIATMDADFSHSPHDLARLFERAITSDPAADVYIGSRYVAGGTIENWSLRRRIASQIVNWLVRARLGMPVRDNSSAMRIYRASTLSRILPGPFCSMSHVYLEELLYRLRSSGASIAEIPITFTDRRQGQSSLSLRSLLRAMFELGMLLLFRWRYR